MKKVTHYLLIICLISCVGCSTTRYRKAADLETYAIIAERTTLVPGMEPNFTIEPTEISLDDLPKVQEENIDAFMSTSGSAEVGCSILPLNRALELAVLNSREYQDQKESLYLSALRFTETRQRYTPVLSGGRINSDYSVTTSDVSKQTIQARLAAVAPDLVTEIGNLTGTSSDLLNSYKSVVENSIELSEANAPYDAIHQERSFSSGTSLNIGMLMKSGAQLALNLSTNFLRNFTGDPSRTASSTLAASIQQPILGSQRRAARETLLQAERNLIYSLRNFTRFRQNFSVGIASDYYRVLRSRDSVRNNWDKFNSNKLNFDRDTERQKAQVITMSDLGRTQEAFYTAENTWLTSIQSYQDDLDAFKIRLGLSTDLPLVLDYKEFDALMAAGVSSHLEFPAGDAVKIAKATRLDYYTSKERLEDSSRKLELAKDGIMPDISIAFDASVRSKGQTEFEDLDFKRYSWGLGLIIDPKIDRKGVRNLYRESLISYDATQRSLEEFEDNITLQVRQSWRAREQARYSYTIEMSRLELSQRRVEQEDILRDIGQGTVLNRIDAQNALTNAKNGVSQSLVNYTTACLRLWYDMGILYIQENGQWEEVSNVKSSE